ncbi:MAG TPA: hypothetical protein DIS90_11730 [Cytophagales bacterium]|nr:hypothetical protein [Cytophagales bacterium]
MKRRDFIKRLSWASVPFAIGGIPLKLMAENPLTRMAQQSNNDRVLVILQMHGGNDGLNCLIPVQAYDEYYSRRANIAIPAKNSLRKMIPLDSTLAADAQVGLHPDMRGMKEMYDQGRMGFIQGVSYKNNNGSHFRGRDISFMGGSFDDYFSSGWVGRFLQQEFSPKVYPNEFPNEDMKDPLAIEMGSDVSLIFHQQGNIPTSISLNDPVSFFNLVNELEGFVDQGVDPRGKPPAFLDNSPYGKELNWILGLEEKSEDYAERLYEVYNNSPEATVTYPERYPFNAPSGSARNRLTPQLKLIARLLDGGGAGLGVKTKVFLVKIGGFDTHAEQVESYDPTMGAHAALMYNISSAMKAFQEDLRARGIEDRVLTVTTSEFGRRIHSNGSYGTDHGTGGPMFLFGKGVQPGVVGKVPDLTKNNVAMQFDYRQVYANLLKDWMLVDEDVINNEIFFRNFINGPKEEGNGNYEPLAIASQVISATQSDFISSRFALKDCYPNPATTFTTIEFRINTTSQVHLQLFDSQGKALKVLLDQTMEAGEHSVQVDLHEFKPGIYLYKLKSGFLKDTKKLVITR